MLSFRNLLDENVCTGTRKNVLPTLPQDLTERRIRQIVAKKVCHVYRMLKINSQALLLGDYPKRTIAKELPAMPRKPLLP